jgi:DNA-binding transcriptional ArsR family regulator
LTQRVDITDPTIAKAYAHPLRIEIMGLLDNRVASPRQIAAELSTPLSNTSYHVRQLASMGLVKLVKRRQRRGSIEHFYTATVQPTLVDDTWARIPSIVKRALVGSRITQLGSELVGAAEAGGLDREDMHFTRTRMTLSREGWRTAARELTAVLERLDALASDEAQALERDPTQERVEATVAMMLFESPPPGIESGEHQRLGKSDELRDVLPS